MILFNAPIPFDDHTARAVKMAVAMRDTIGALTERWRNRGPTCTQEDHADRRTQCGPLGAQAGVLVSMATEIQMDCR
jgi:hypothetical protein